VNFVPMDMPLEDAVSTGEGGATRSAEVAYTLVMLDPYVPSREDPAYRSFRHWVVCRLLLIVRRRI